MPDSQAVDTVSKTIADLETRLRRIEFATTGQNRQDGIVTGKGSAAVRLRDLEQKLNQVTSRSRSAQELLNLYIRHPGLFPGQDQRTPPAALDPSSLQAIILSSASSYQLTASRFTSVFDVPIPDAEASAQLIKLQPRVARLELLQTEQEKELTELKKRSALILQRWYAVDVLGVGDCWAEAEGRVTAVEQTIRRVETTREKDAEMI